MGFLTPQAHGEHDVLTTFALQQLAQLRTTVTGLTDDEAQSTPSASALSLTGLLRHCGAVAVFWSASAAAAPGEPTLPRDIDHGTLEDLCANRAGLADALAVFDRCVEITRDNLAAVRDLAAPVPVPDAPWYPDDLTSWEARWAVTHIIAEVGRHTGHADVIRESIDGAGAFELNDRADAGEPTPR